MMKYHQKKTETNNYSYSGTYYAGLARAIINMYDYAKDDGECGYAEFAGYEGLYVEGYLYYVSNNDDVIYMESTWDFYLYFQEDSDGNLSFELVSEEYELYDSQRIFVRE